MKIKTNYSSSNDSKNPLNRVPPGLYDARIFGTDCAQASTGTPCLNVEFEITGPTSIGRHIWGNVYLTQKASWKYSSLCAAVGITPGEDLETADLHGKTLRIVVKEVEGPSGWLGSEAVGFRKLKSTPTSI